ncbi:DUF5994 family protein [Nocardia sp. NBC_00565]|uniref:DUF5994 family protein n=1 Tax=Nocardia sp. NBC_00565 TaxID=2975993 RepID=UPI002E7FE483|nr:DUF5994 family protein [Nocardia sp. NBC_00565]WUC00969.1 DUF5994 family protein [Nocardia sp. NBC_00565]
MTHQLTRTDSGKYGPTPRRPRLRLESSTDDTASVDGVWCPRGNDLVAELPDLLMAVATRLGPIHRVIYHLDEWATAPRKLASGGRLVRLDGYRHKPRHTLGVLGVSGAQLTVAVVTPADTETSAAQQRWDSEGGAGA